jgi:DNA invertase Pin-like site-specific DNA recombinase
MRTTTALDTVAEPVRAIIYLRLSDLRDEDLNDVGKGKSFDDREAKLRDLAARLGWTVVKVVTENDVIKKNGKHRPASAFKKRKVTLPDGSVAMRVIRPGFQSILHDFASGVANGLLAEDLDRCMRDPRDLEDLIDVAEQRRINARSISGSLTLTNGGTDAEVTMARMMVTMANKSSRDTSRRVAAARERKARGGEFGGGPRPFGFESDGLTPRDDEVAIIKDFFRRIRQISDITGKQTSLRQYARELQESDVPTVTGAPWAAGILKDVMCKIRNKGRMQHQGQDVGPAPWPELVDPAVFDDVVDLLNDGSRRTGPGPARKYLGSGIYLCGVCDDSSTMMVSRGTRAPHYVCGNKNAPRHLSRSLHRVDAHVISVLMELCSDKRLLHRLAKPGVTVDIPALKAQRDSIKANLARMAGDAAIDVIDRETYLAAASRAKTTISEIDEKIRDSTIESPVSVLLDADDVAVEFDKQPLSSQRAILSRTLRVQINRSSKKGPAYDPSAVVITPIV